MDRFFYHSFPRIRPGVEYEQIINDGMHILTSIWETGVILAPEIVRWKQSLSDGTYRDSSNRQVRISFTELSPAELEKHSKYFGPFSIEFGISDLRKVGALPVIYMPQHLEDGKNISSVGTTLVTQLGDARYLLGKLQELRNHLDYLKQLREENELVAPNVNFNLKNTNPDDPTITEKEYNIPENIIEDFLSFLSFSNAPFHLLEGVLTAMQNLFYPTDDEIHNELLAYYRQREWRLIAGVALNGNAQSRQLNEEEKAKLIKINPQFWTRELSDAKISKRRVDEAVVIEKFWDGHISDLITKIRVPKICFEKAHELFGDKVVPNEFD